jgi:hypothetical protein
MQSVSAPAYSRKLFPIVHCICGPNSMSCGVIRWRAPKSYAAANKFQNLFNFGSPGLFTVTFRESRSNIHL